MTSTTKVYQNYRFDDLISFAKQNPHRARRLTPMAILGGEGDGGREKRAEKETGVRKETVVRKEKDTVYGLEGYQLYDLQPTGILGLVACMEDPHAYALSTPAIRAQQAMEWCTRLQQRTDELRNGPLARKRKRIYEGLGAVYNGSTTLEEKDYADLFHGLEELQQAYFIRMNRAVQENMESDSKESANTILFSSCPLLWKRDRPIWLVDAHGKWMAMPTDAVVPLVAVLSGWLSQMETSGWIIEWPEAPGGKTEIVEQLVAIHSWEESDKKLTKDILSRRLGKQKTLRLFNQWKSVDQVELEHI